MTDSHFNNSSNDTAPIAHTEIRTDADLGAALAEILASRSVNALKPLRETLLGLRSEFDPRSITISSTNIPDAILKLSSVLTETDAASNKVFDLVESQKKIMKRGEKYLKELEQIAQEPQVSSAVILKFIAKYHALNYAMRSASHDIVISQDFQDLCGQKIKKVIKLVCDVECYLRVLLEQLKVDLPSPMSAAELEQDQKIDQESTDSLLRELGL